VEQDIIVQVHGLQNSLPTTLLQAEAPNPTEKCRESSEVPKRSESLQEVPKVGQDQRGNNRHSIMSGDYPLS
jgi:hypothetical protein